MPHGTSPPVSVDVQKRGHPASFEQRDLKNRTGSISDISVDVDEPGNLTTFQLRHADIERIAEVLKNTFHDQFSDIVKEALSSGIAKEMEVLRQHNKKLQDRVAVLEAAAEDGQGQVHKKLQT